MVFVCLFCFSKELEGLVVWEKHQLRLHVLLGQVVATEVARIGHDAFEVPGGDPHRDECEP